MERLLALQHPALSRLGELIVQKEFPSTSMAAVRDVLDRTLGKPAETVAMTVEGTFDFISTIRKRRERSQSG